MIRILTKNGVENTNIDGARDHHFNANGISGIVKGVMSEIGIAPSSDKIYLGTGELRLLGHRIVLDSMIAIPLTSRPASDIRYSIVAKLTMTNQDPSFDFVIQTPDTPLQTDDVNSGDGVYELEIGQFTLQPSGVPKNIVKTAKIFYPVGYRISSIIIEDDTIEIEIS